MPGAHHGDDLRLGLLGCGFFGRSLANGVARQPGATVVAVADAVAETASEVAESIGARATTLESLLTDFDLDAVLVATPNALHRDHVVACCEAGIDVFVEKPMALTTSDCDAMLAAAQRAGTRLLVGHILRTLPGVRRISAMIFEGRLGAIQDAQGWLVRTTNRSGPKDWWKYDISRSGGELFHEIHVLDLLCWLLDPRELVALGNPDHTTIVMRSGEALVTYELSPVSRSPQWGFIVNGTEASVALDMRASTVTVIADGHRQVSGLFDDDASNQSLVGTASKPAAHNRAGNPTALWMQRAIEIEMAEALRVFRGAETSPLLDVPDRSVRVAAAAISHMASGWELH